MTERSISYIIAAIIVGILVSFGVFIVHDVRGDTQARRQLEQRVEKTLPPKTHVRECLRFITAQVACAVEYEPDDSTTRREIVTVPKHLLAPTSDGGVE